MSGRVDFGARIVTGPTFGDFATKLQCWPGARRLVSNQFQELLGGSCSYERITSQPLHGVESLNICGHVVPLIQSRTESAGYRNTMEYRVAWAECVFRRTWTLDPQGSTKCSWEQRRERKLWLCLVLSDIPCYQKVCDGLLRTHGSRGLRMDQLRKPGRLRSVCRVRWRVPCSRLDPSPCAPRPRR